MEKSISIPRSYIRPAARLSRISLGFLGVINVLFVAAVLYKFLQPGASESVTEVDPALFGVMTQMCVGAAFSLLGIFLLGLSGHRPGVIMLSAFLLSQGLAIGFLMVLGLIGANQFQFHVARFLINWMAYTFALRTVQLFPRRINRQSMLVNRPLGPLTLLVDSLRGSTRAGLFSAAILITAYLFRSELLFHVGQLLVIVVVVLTMTTNYRLGGPRIRRKIYWLLLGTLILLLARLFLASAHALLEFSSLPIPGIRSIVWAAANISLLGCVSFAVFYRGAVDPRTVVRRAAVYSLSIISILFAFAAFENYLSGLITEFLDINRGSVSAVGGAAVALLIKPVIDFLTRVAERILPRI